MTGDLLGLDLGGPAAQPYQQPAMQPTMPASQPPVSGVMDLLGRDGPDTLVSIILKFYVFLRKGR